MKRIVICAVAPLFLMFIMLTIFTGVFFSKFGYFGFNSFLAIIENNRQFNDSYFSVQNALNAFVSEDGGDIFLNAVTFYIYPTIRLIVSLIATLIDYTIIFFEAAKGGYNQPYPPGIPSSEWVPIITMPNLLFK